MPPMRRVRVGTPEWRRAWLAGLLLTVGRLARAAPDATLPVGDPLAAELRLLDLTDPGPEAGRLLLPHLGTRPLQWRELMGGAPPAEPADPARAISLVRLGRALARHATPGFAAHPSLRSAPFLWRAAAEGDAVELSAGLEGRGETDRFDSRFVSGSGVQARVTAAFGPWVIDSRLLLGQVDDARSFADPIAPQSDLIVHSEDTSIGYTAGDGRWGARLGRSRWAWGPGEDGSLALSATSPASTALAARARIEPLRADLALLAGTLDHAAA